MYTQCPHCAARFAISADELGTAGGHVVCGACEREFDALERLRLPAGVAAPPRLGGDRFGFQGELFPTVVAEDPTARPHFARQKAPAVTHSGRWLLAACLLAISLGAQIVAAQRNDLARDPNWRQNLEALCSQLGCPIDEWREPDAWQLIAREIGPHPSAADALQVTATLRNDAAFAQGLPHLELALSNLDGKPLALRRFAPAEYIGEDAKTMKFAPGSTVNARLEISDPGRDALAFSFAFR